MMKVTIESITEAAASLKTQAERLDDISSQLSRIESRLRQSSTKLDSQIQSIERQRQDIEQRRQTLNQLIQAADSAAEQYQQCEQDAITGNADTDPLDGLSFVSVDIPLNIVGPGGQAPSINDLIDLFDLTLIWPLTKFFVLPIRQIWVGPAHKPRIPIIPIPGASPARPIRPLKPVDSREIHPIVQVLIRPLMLLK